MCITRVSAAPDNTSEVLRDGSVFVASGLHVYVTVDSGFAVVRGVGRGGGGGLLFPQPRSTIRIIWKGGGNPDPFSMRQFMSIGVHSYNYVTNLGFVSFFFLPSFVLCSIFFRSRIKFVTHCGSISLLRLCSF